MAWLHRPGTKLRPILPPDSDYPHATGSGGAIKAAWSGGCIDTQRAALVSFGGGHGDGAMNGIFREFASGAAPEVICAASPYADCAQRLPEPAEQSSDPNPRGGKPCSRHSYAGVSYIEHIDAVWCTGGSRWHDAGPSRRSWLMPLSGPTAGVWQMKADFSAGVVAAGNAYDPLTGFGYVLSNGGQLRRHDFGPADSYTNLGPPLSTMDIGNMDPIPNSVFDPDRKWFMLVGPRGGGRPFPNNPPFLGQISNTIRYVDTNNVAAGSQLKTFTGDTTWMQIEGVAFARHPGGKYYAWDGRNMVWEVDLDANTSTLLPVENWPGQALPTGDSVKRGRWHSWGWVSAYNAFLCSPSVDTDVMLYTLGATKLIDTAGGILVEPL